MTGIRVPNVNFVILAGRLTRDPEVKYLPSGKAVVRLRMASGRRFLNKNTNEWQEETTYADVTVWGDAAQRAGERLHKGSPVFVEGRLKFREWEAKDGTKRSSLEIDAQRIQFLETTGTGETPAGNGAFSSPGAAVSGFDSPSSIASGSVEAEVASGELEEVAI